MSLEPLTSVFSRQDIIGRVIYEEPFHAQTDDKALVLVVLQENIAEIQARDKNILHSLNWWANWHFLNNAYSLLWTLTLPSFLFLTLLKSLCKISGVPSHQKAQEKWKLEKPRICSLFSWKAAIMKLEATNRNWARGVYECRPWNNCPLCINACLLDWF